MIILLAGNKNKYKYFHMLDIRFFLDKCKILYIFGCAKGLLCCNSTVIKMQVSVRQTSTVIQV